MRFHRFVQVVDTHTAGEPTRVVLSGIPPIPGRTMEERRRWLAENADDLRRFLLREPRGHTDMFGAIVTQPCSPDADSGVIFLDNGGYLGMCGHGTIGVATALASLGWIDGERVTLDTPSGPVRCRIHRDANGVQAVTFRNVPSFYLTTVRWEGVPVHIAYGGNLFALVEAAAVGIGLVRESLPELMRLGMEIRRWANENHRFRHPATGGELVVELVEFYEEGTPPRNVVVFGEGQVDRSPCGTGTCAKMAYLHAEGRLGVGDEYRYRSILDTEFVGRIVAETELGGTKAIVPEITGSAYITGFGELVLVEGDPFPMGFQLFPSPWEPGKGET
ncbi:TPA: proline racemase [Candidatus Bipolaricaulota bacterium]|nr:proline racemase [Candidatus Bipolaricaulota bacterium]